MDQIGESFRKQGKRNKSHGDAFEKICESRADQLKLDLIVKRIDRTFRRGVSLPDLEFVDFPEYKPDCKFTEGSFTLAEMKKLILETQMKYGDLACCIFGQKYGRAKLKPSESLFGYLTEQKILVLIPYDQFLWWLHFRKQCILNRSFLYGNANDPASAAKL